MASSYCVVGDRLKQSELKNPLFFSSLFLKEDPFKNISLLKEGLAE